MSDDTQNTAVRKGLYTIWAFITLILIFTLVLMVIELAQTRNDNRSTNFSTTKNQHSPIGAVPDFQTPDINLYFSHPEMVLLTPEPRRIELTDSTIQNCKRTMEALIHGPIKHLVPVMPSSTHIRGMFLLDNGELIIDFSRELEAGHIKSTSTEWLWIQSVAHTMTQDALIGSDGNHVRSIRFLFEGAPAQSSFPQHVDVSDPVMPAPSAISSVVESLGNV
ncbi:MAG: hypothetical protein COA73_00155 [Candidatus Hydrogenedentota bacterium]|nr:MAG: hypothetical protein COA73_00155 [Candidatus Hydrogenedentota bacterium]